MSSLLTTKSQARRQRAGSTKRRSVSQGQCCPYTCAKILLLDVPPGYERAYWSGNGIGCLQHGSGICEQIEDEDLLRIGLRPNATTASTSDKTFLQVFRTSARSKNSKYPPAALVEVYLDREAEVAKLRRLHRHLIVIDLQHPRRPQSAAAKMAYQGMLEAREAWVANTLPIPFKRGENWRCRYAYA